MKNSPFFLRLRLVRLLSAGVLALVACHLLACAAGSPGTPSVSEDTGTNGADVTTPDEDTATPEDDLATPDDTGYIPTDTGWVDEDTAIWPDTGSDTGPTCYCDDGNECTNDLCNPDGSCTHLPAAGHHCRPVVTITYPPQAATFSPGESFTIKVDGTVSAPAGLASLTLNGRAITETGGTFSDGEVIKHGINTVKVEVTDVVGVKDNAVHSFMIGEGFYGTTYGAPGDPVTNGIAAFLGQEVWDDDDTSDVDDIATVMKMVLEGLDIMSLLPNPLYEEIIGCDYTITFESVSFNVTNVDLMTLEGGLMLDATLSNIQVKLDAVTPAYLCPNAENTTVDIASASVESIVWIWLDEAGNVQVQLSYVAVDVGEVDVVIDSGALSLVDWLVSWFTNTFDGYLESAIEDAVLQSFGPTISSALESFTSYTTTFTIPPLPGGLKSVDLTVEVSPTYIYFEQAGAIIGLGAAITAPKGASWIESPGSLARNGCLGSQDTGLDIPKTSPIAMALHDDLINQVLFAGWWGGVVHTNVPPELLTGALEGTPVAVSNLVVTLDPWLPPVITACTDSGDVELQLGAMRVMTNLELAGKPAAVEVMAAATVSANLSAVEGMGDTLSLAIEVKAVKLLDFHLVDLSGAVEGIEPIIAVLLDEILVKVVIDYVGQGFVQSFPVPTLDLGGLLPGLPAGTTIGLSPASLHRDEGYIVLTGSVSN